MRNTKHIVVFIVLMSLLPSHNYAQKKATSDFSKYEAEWLETLSSFDKEEPVYFLWSARVAGFYSYSGRDALSESYLQQALHGAEAWLSEQGNSITSEEQGHFAQMHSSLAMTFTRQGRTSDAASSLQKRLEFLLKNSERFESDVIQAKQDLAVNYTLSNDFTRAETLFEEALDLLGTSIEHSRDRKSTESNDHVNSLLNSLQAIDEIRTRRVIHNYLQMKARRSANKSCYSRFNRPMDSIYQMTYILPTIDCE